MEQGSLKPEQDARGTQVSIFLLFVCLFVCLFMELRYTRYAAQFHKAALCVAGKEEEEGDGSNAAIAFFFFV